MQGTTDTITTARRTRVCLDLTNLEDGCDAAAIDALCAQAQSPRGSVAAVCVWPRFVARAKAALARTGIKVATVVNFPAGTGSRDDVAREAQEALAAGADEIDVVVPWEAHAAGETDAIETCLAAVREAGGASIKAILETGGLSDAALIATAAERAMAGGADFLKTSTGKIAAGATPQAAEILLEAIRRAGSGTGLKVSGGVRNLEDAAVYLGLCDRIMGAGWAGPKHFRIGASSLLGVIDAALARAPDGRDDEA